MPKELKFVTLAVSKASLCVCVSLSLSLSVGFRVIFFFFGGENVCVYFRTIMLFGC